jgi:catechol 2,3-dioxygenase-like lactoylglutathione lyase family enzyme
VELIPSDFERGVRFYTDVLGFKLTWRIRPPHSKWDEIVFVELGGHQIEIKSYKNPGQADTSPRIGWPRIALLTGDLDAALAFLKTKGVEPTGPVRIADGPGTSTLKTAEIRDPDGLSIELMQRDG